MVSILRPTQTRRATAGPGLACPGCEDTLAPWGYVWARSVRSGHGTPELSLRPRRVRCRGCRATQVPLPAACLPRRADTVEVIVAARLAAATGTSHRCIAADLDRPADTVRGWIRRATAHAPHLREHATILAHQFDPLLPSIRSAPSLLGDAMEALGAAVAAATRRPGVGTHHPADQRTTARPDRPYRLRPATCTAPVCPAVGDSMTTNAPADPPSWSTSVSLQASTSSSTTSPSSSLGASANRCCGSALGPVQGDAVPAGL